MSEILLFSFQIRQPYLDFTREAPEEFGESIIIVVGRNHFQSQCLLTLTSSNSAAILDSKPAVTTAGGHRAPSTKRLPNAV